jgi:hypothetical protein
VKSVDIANFYYLFKGENLLRIWRGLTLFDACKSAEKLTELVACVALTAAEIETV